MATLAGVHPSLASAAQAIINASGGRIWLVSGYRSYAQQAQLYAAYKAGRGNLAAPPGKSKHNHGLAIDFGGDMKLLAQLAGRYSLIAAVPGEPWHYELSDQAAQTAGQGGGQYAVQDFGTTVVDEETAKQRAKEVYGYLGAFVDHPEVGPIILQGAREGWAAERLQGALSQTEWWRHTSETSRQWDAMTAADPATAERRVDETSLGLRIQAERSGFSLDPGRAEEISTNANRFGWSQEELQVALAAEMRFRPETAERGAVGAIMQEVRSTASEYMVQTTPHQEWMWARRIIGGGADMEAVRAQMQTLARGRFSHIGDLIDQGVTPAQYFTPLRNEIAQTLETSPDGVNLMEERWSPVTSLADGTQLRSMTFAEATRYARMQPEWLETRNAWDTLSNVGGGILQMFGGQ